MCFAVFDKATRWQSRQSLSGANSLPIWKMIARTLLSAPSLTRHALVYCYTDMIISVWNVCPLIHVAWAQKWEEGGYLNGFLLCTFLLLFAEFK